MTDRRPTDPAIITRALASNLLGRLMDEYGLTPERAGELAARAIERHRRGKLDAKPLDEPGG